MKALTMLSGIIYSLQYAAFRHTFFDDFECVTIVNLNPLCQVTAKVGTIRIRGSLGTIRAGRGAAAKGAVGMEVDRAGVGVTKIISAEATSKAMGAAQYAINTIRVDLLRTGVLWEITKWVEVAAEAVVATALETAAVMATWVIWEATWVEEDTKLLQIFYVSIHFFIQLIHFDFLKFNLHIPP